LKMCVCCGDLKKIAGKVILPKTGDIEVCSQCLTLFKQQFRKMEKRGQGKYYDITVPSR
jgi:hypothetical protein